MNIDIRQASHPKDVRSYGTEQLREAFLVQGIFRPGEAVFTYSHVDRLIVGGVVPLSKPVALPSSEILKTKTFLERREMSIINVGGDGYVTIDGARHELAPRDALYVGKGAADVAFVSADEGNPAKFYLISAAAYETHPTVKIAASDAKQVHLGDHKTANKRTLFQYIHPDICKSCQLLVGLTQLEPGNIWNTMPSHIHDRRSEVYLYLDLPETARVVHLMGEPDHTRHLIVANEEVVLSPGWSIHSGVGTSSYAFVWAMAGDNQDFGDMDFIAMDALR
jgi:4-deoxy-L-threo-5-hexosulose-uronate ketol-isomerase